MDRTHKKTLALWLYAIYFAILIAAISLGNTLGLATLATEAFQRGWFIVASDTHIEDISLKSSTFTVGKSHVLEYDIIGEYKGNPGLIFRPVGENAFDKFSSTGAFIVKSIEGDSREAQIRVTSKYDPNFEKILTVTVEKKYPEEFTANFLSKSAGYDTYALVGVPLSVFITPADDSDYSHKDFEIIYDPEYFRLGETPNTLVPIKETPEGEEVSFTCRCPNGAYSESTPFTVKKAEAQEEFDEVRIWSDGMWRDISNVTFRSDRKYVPSFYKDGKRFFTDYDISIAEDNNEKNVPNGFIYFTDPNTSDITVSLPNGFTKTFEVNVFNELVMPEIDGADGDKMLINDTETSSFPFKFDSEAYFRNLTFEYDKKMLSLTATSDAIRLKGIREGETAFSLVLDDGEQRLVKTYTVQIESGKSTFDKIYDQAHKIMAKSLGHFLSFAVLAVFAANLFRFVETKKKSVRFLLYSSGAFAAACITEIIQSFIPSRTASFVDIIIDMLGFYIGTAAVILLVYVIKKLLRRFRRADE